MNPKLCRRLHSLVQHDSSLYAATSTTRQAAKHNLCPHYYERPAVDREYQSLIASVAGCVAAAQDAKMKIPTNAIRPVSIATTEVSGRDAWLTRCKLACATE